ncbi:S41 family peptidase [Lentimicrobium sp. L6]|uniref:S41 family peptidase n=1 Tax=Lentimicrobium sp. L6 TaxID=2735916 RepID=UPI0015578E5F|nr:S41 family peptidase [Lentimicrobium sp. L6]NPD85450.1 S41 family peptidase [Lentimicrobium sp. L6]
MKIGKKIISILMLILVVFQVSAQEELVFNEEFKSEVVKNTAIIMKNKYLSAETGKIMGEYIISQYKMGVYDSLNEVNEFCNKLTSDMRFIDNDKHLFVFYSQEEAWEVKAYHHLLPEKEIQELNKMYLEMDKRENFGYKKVELLEGNVGYLKLSYFTISDTSNQALIGSMQFLSNSDAIIIDLRDNGGGEGNDLLLNYFLPPQLKYLGSMSCRDTSMNQEFWTLTDVPGKRMPEVDLYVLTNKRTFSAAEGLAFSLQKLERAIIVGETTKGGGHPVDILIVKGDVLTQFPICKSNEPNWESVGIKPDIEVASSEALTAAYKIAVEKILEKTLDAQHKVELEKILEKLKKE